MSNTLSGSVWFAAITAMVIGCSSHQGDSDLSPIGPGGSGNATGGGVATQTGGASAGGTANSGGAPMSGGKSTSGSATGGNPTGGATATGTTNTGGAISRASGGAVAGGAGTGGTSTGGATIVGSAGSTIVGGTGAGGSTSANTGGLASGGASARGGANTGGANTGGSVSASGGSSTTQGGSTAGYSPCPALPAPCKIMPSGDSITVGAQSTDTGGYRVPLFHTTLVNKQTITFVGPSGAGPDTVDGVAFPQSHDGHSGYIIDTVGTRKGLAPLMDQNLVTYAPHIVLLMIGTNDINSQVDVANAPARLAALIDKITTFAPNALLVVAQITPNLTDTLDAAVKAFNAAIPAIISERAKAGKHVLLVDMYGAFTANASYKTSLMFDGLHPNDAGYAVMAKVWYTAIGGFLR